LKKEPGGASHGDVIAAAATNFDPDLHHHASKSHTIIFIAHQFFGR
jgi:hypothetical protein